MMWWQSFSIVFGLDLLSFIVACPVKCKCTWYRRNKHANVHCRSRNLTEIPHGIPRQTVLLDLQNNNLRYIKPKAFEHLTNLKSLLLMGTNLKNLSADAFVGLQNLRELTLTSNRIATLEIIFGLGLLSLVVACPLKCKCTWNRRNKLASVHCRSRNLTEVPHGIPRLTLLLDLQNNDLQEQCRYYMK